MWFFLYLEDIGHSMHLIYRKYHYYAVVDYIVFFEYIQPQKNETSFPCLTPNSKIQSFSVVTSFYKLIMYFVLNLFQR